MDSAALERPFRSCRLVGSAMAGFVLVLAAGVRFLPPGAMEAGPARAFRNILLALALGQMLMVPFLRRLILSSRSQATAAARLQASALIGLAVSEAQAIYGLVLYLTTGDLRSFYAFAALSAAGFALTFPRFSQWQEWASGIR